MLIEVGDYFDEKNVTLEFKCALSISRLLNLVVERFGEQLKMECRLGLGYKWDDTDNLHGKYGRNYRL